MRSLSVVTKLGFNAVGLFILTTLILFSPLTARSSPASPDGVMDALVVVPEGQPIQISAAIWHGWENYQDLYAVVQMAIDDYGNIHGFDVAVNEFPDCGLDGGPVLANAIIAEEQNVGLIGPFCSSSTVEAAPILEINQVVMISYSNTMIDLYNHGPSIFNRTVLPDPQFEPWDLKVQDLTTVIDWKEQVAALLGHTPDNFMAYAYDATILLLTRIDSVSTVNVDGDLEIDRAELAQAVRLTDGFTGITGDLTLNSFGDRLDTIISWQDHFNDSTLVDEWSWIREDPSLWSLTERPGFLRLMTHQGGLGSSDHLAKNLFVSDAPFGDYTFVTRMDFDPQENFQLAGLLVYLDDNNYMLFGRAYCDIPTACVGNGIYFDYVEGGELASENFAMTTMIPPESTYLALTRTGSIYTGWVSSDGINWQEVGSHTSAFPFQKIGLSTTNGNQPTEGIPADFDFFLMDDYTKYLYLPSVLKP
jgi:hypothetical protein